MALAPKGDKEIKKQLISPIAAYELLWGNVIDQGELFAQSRRKGGRVAIGRRRLQGIGHCGLQLWG